MYGLKYSLIILIDIFNVVVQAEDIDKAITVDGLNRQHLKYLLPGYYKTEQLPVVFALNWWPIQKHTQTI
jgi:hypothetical protein